MVIDILPNGTTLFLSIDFDEIDDPGGRLDKNDDDNTGVDLDFVLLKVHQKFPINVQIARYFSERKYNQSS